MPISALELGVVALGELSTDFSYAYTDCMGHPEDCYSGGDGPLVEFLNWVWPFLIGAWIVAGVWQHHESAAERGEQTRRRELANLDEQQQNVEKAAQVEADEPRAASELLTRSLYLAKGPATGSEELAELAHSPYCLVRREVARHPATPTRVLERLWNDEDAAVANAAARALCARRGDSPDDSQSR